MTQRSSYLTAAGYMLIYTISYAALWACIRHLSSDIHPLVLVFFRTFFGMIVILPVLLKVRLPDLKSGLYPLYILRGILNITSVIGAFFAVSLIPLADAVAFSYIAPIFAALMGITLFGDPLNGLTFIGGGIILASAVYAAHRERKISQAVTMNG